MADRFDVAVVGLGAMGSAAAYHLAAAGTKVVGFDARRPPHTAGSSHGESRITRHAYWEDPAYVPLVRRATELWQRLQAEAGRPLLHRTGALLMGVPDGDVVPGVRRAREAHGVQVEDLSPAELRRRFPQYRMDDGMEATFEPGAGVLLPEACVQAHLDLARARGADLRVDTPILGVEPRGDGWEVRTAGSAVRAGRVVLASGAWMGAHARIGLAIERQILYWSRPADPEAFRLGRAPVFAVETEPGRLVYGFPDLGTGVKVALHHQGEAADPDRPRREPDAAERRHIEALLRRYAPGAAGGIVATVTCMYANTLDQDFTIGADPDRPGVLLASACSGHGFKFASAIGEALTALATGQRPPVAIGAFDPARLRAPDVRVRPPKGPPVPPG